MCNSSNFKRKCPIEEIIKENFATHNIPVGMSDVISCNGSLYYQLDISV